MLSVQVFRSVIYEGDAAFQPTKCGFCCKVQTVVSSHGDCEHYEAKLYRYKKDVFLKGCLSDLLTEISELRSMLEAEHHEEDV